jgi:hypothetical protein
MNRQALSCSTSPHGPDPKFGLPNFEYTPSISEGAPKSASPVSPTLVVNLRPGITWGLRRRSAPLGTFRELRARGGLSAYTIVCSWEPGARG